MRNVGKPWEALVTGFFKEPDAYLIYFEVQF